jgi:hypothetical protein
VDVPAVRPGDYLVSGCIHRSASGLPDCLKYQLANGLFRHEIHGALEQDLKPLDQAEKGPGVFARSQFLKGDEEVEFAVLSVKVGAGTRAKYMGPAPLCAEEKW